MCVYACVCLVIPVLNITRNKQLACYRLRLSFRLATALDADAEMPFRFSGLGFELGI